MLPPAASSTATAAAVVIAAAAGAARNGAGCGPRRQPEKRRRLSVAASRSALCRGIGMRGLSLLRAMGTPGLWVFRSLRGTISSIGSAERTKLGVVVREELDELGATSTRPADRRRAAVHCGAEGARGSRGSPRGRRTGSRRRGGRCPPACPQLVRPGRRFVAGDRDRFGTHGGEAGLARHGAGAFVSGDDGDAVRVELTVAAQDAVQKLFWPMNPATNADDGCS